MATVPESLQMLTSPCLVNMASRDPSLVIDSLLTSEAWMDFVVKSDRYNSATPFGDVEYARMSPVALYAQRTVDDTLEASVWTLPSFVCCTRWSSPTEMNE